MPAGCSVPDCTNSSVKGVKKLRMPRFPREGNRRQEWLKVIGRPDWHPYEGARICEAHFTPDQWETPHRLKTNAVPSVKPIFSCSCEKDKKAWPARLMHDHTYFSIRNSSCKIHGRCSSAVPLAEILKENCKLQDTVHQLQKQLIKQQTEEKKTIDGRKYSPEDIRRGLGLRFACGTSGYNSVRDILGAVTPVPSVRVLQAATEHLKFPPGILYEVTEPLKAKFEFTSDERDRDIVLVFDELAIKKRIEYDASLKKFLGYCTIPGQEGLIAEKGEIYVFRGCHRKFKQVVAYHFNTSTVPVKEKAKFLINLLQMAEDVNANVIAIVCDMGNRGVLAELGFCTRKDSLKFCIPNPVNLEKRLWCVADPVHLFKSLKECLCSNRFMELPAPIMSEFKLPSAMVDIGHIEWLEKFQRDENLQLVPGLTLKDLNSTHFSKMKVKSSHKVVNHKVGSSLSYLVLKGLVPEAFESTAWFIKLMNRWFQLTTSRTCLLALGHKNKEAYAEAIVHLKLVIRVFENLKIPGGWKPVQSHIIFTTKSLLEIQEHLLNERNYQFLFTGNFTSDVAENVNSKIRMTNPMPTALEMKNRLKHLVISHFNKKISTSSYNHDDAEDLVDLMLQRDGQAFKEQLMEELDLSQFKWTPTINAGEIKSHVDDVLYRMCGYVVISLRKRRMLTCTGCIDKLRYKGETPHPNATFMILMDFTPGAQFPVTDILFRLLRLVEFNLKKWAPKLKDVFCLERLVDAVVKPAVAPYFPLQTCHEVKDKIVKVFCVMRFRQLGMYVLSPSESVTSTALSSKTAGAQFLTSNYKSSTPKGKTKTMGMKRLLTLK